MFLSLNSSIKVYMLYCTGPFITMKITFTHSSLVFEFLFSSSSLFCILCNIPLYKSSKFISLFTYKWILGVVSIYFLITITNNVSLKTIALVFLYIILQ